MKSMFQYIAAVACVAALTACGGGAKTPTAVVVSQPAFKLTDTVVGTGTQAATGDLVVINFTGYLYDASKPDFKGGKVESSVDTGKPATPFTVGVGSMATGWDQSILGVAPIAAMKVGGKRTAILPASLMYGAFGHDVPSPNPYGYVALPANSPMVYDFELVDVVKNIPTIPVDPPKTLLKVDTLIGSGATVAAGQTVTVNYALYLYDGTRADLRGPLVKSTIGQTADDFVLTDNKVITGWIQGVPGMQVGGKRTLTVPPDLGYGAVAQTGIPANSTLIFDIVLVSVK